MEVPMCYLCHKDPYVTLRKGDSVRFADYRPPIEGFLGDFFPERWFCEDHLAEAQKLSHFPAKKALAELQKKFGFFELPELPPPPPPSWFERAQAKWPRWNLWFSPSPAEIEEEIALPPCTYCFERPRLTGGAFVQFARDEFTEEGENVRWFCNDHLVLAQPLSHLLTDEALYELALARREESKRIPLSPPESVPLWKEYLLTAKELLWIFYVLACSAALFVVAVGFLFLLIKSSF